MQVSLSLAYFRTHAGQGCAYQVRSQDQSINERDWRRSGFSSAVHSNPQWMYLLVGVVFVDVPRVWNDEGLVM
jgi:hypothetical protein